MIFIHLSTDTSPYLSPRCIYLIILINVLGNRNCTFLAGDRADMYIDHRSQMMYFCGQEFWCILWNTKYVLQAAKRSVEKIYEVVGGIYLCVYLSISFYLCTCISLITLSIGQHTFSSSYVM